ncbi:MAG: cyclodeaminase/cyclohydrolase family protein [Thermoplasmata archaeon]
MGLESAPAFRSFVEELSSDRPSPGGGTASAAAGSMAAALLIMVCRITAKSKKHKHNTAPLDMLEAELTVLRDRLMDLAELDAAAYDDVVMTNRRMKGTGTQQSSELFRAALKHAADVPMMTAEACLKVLEIGQKVKEIGLRTTSSDVTVALLLAEAALAGGLANVEVNLASITDDDYVRTVSKRVDELRRRAREILTNNASA